MVYDIPAIETSYKGRVYRSRLEARWAAMFDLLGWRYEYEPFDLNGWFPDFLIIAKNPLGRVLVEVKPIIDMDLGITARIDRACPYASEDKDTEEILLLGATIYPFRILDELDGYGVRLGWIRDYFWSSAILLRSWEDMKNPIGFYSYSGSYQDRITGEAEGDHHIGPVDPYDILDMWQRAGNMVRYRHSK